MFVLYSFSFVTPSSLLFSTTICFLLSVLISALRFSLFSPPQSPTFDSIFIAFSSLPFPSPTLLFLLFILLFFLFFMFFTSIFFYLFLLLFISSYFILFSSSSSFPSLVSSSSSFSFSSHRHDRYRSSSCA